MDFWNRLRRALLAIALSALALGLLVRWAVPAQASWAGSIQPGGSAKTVGPPEAALLAASIKLTKTVGTESGICATDAITVPANAQVTYCYQATNTSSDITFTMHTLYEYSLDWTWSSTATLGPGESMVVTKPTIITQTIVAEALWTAISGTVVTNDRDATTVTVAEASIAFTKTVGTNPTICATGDTITVPLGTDVTYCYKVTNTGLFTLTKHTISDTKPVVILIPLLYDLGPGESHFVSTTTTISNTTVNTATWTAYDALDNSDVATDTATVTVHTAPPTSQVLYPQQHDFFTRTGTLTVTGIAWQGDKRPTFPPDPVLDSIDNSDSDGNYYVTWEPVSLALNYVLEESADDPFFHGQTNSYSEFEFGMGKHYKYLTGKAPSTYYYRLKAHNLSGESRWSNIQSVVVSHTAWALDNHFFEPAVLPAQPLSRQGVSTTYPITVWVRVDNVPVSFTAVLTPEQTWWAWTAQVPLPVTDYSLHTIQTWAQDATGHTGPTDVITIALDNRAPTSTITNLIPGQWLSQPYTITGTIGNDQAPEASRAEVRINTGEWVTANGSSPWWYLWEPAGPDGIYTITTRAIDGVGNISQPTDGITVTVDKPLPAPTGLTVLSTTAFSVHLTWTAVTESDVASYTLYWGTAKSAYSHSRNVGLTTTYALTNLNPVTTYYLAVSAHDRRSESPLSTPISATTEIAKVYLPMLAKRWPPLPYAPTLHDIATPDYHGNYTISWSYNYTSAPVVTYSLQEATNAAFTTDVENYYPGQSTSQTISSQSPGLYYYRVRGHNSYGRGEWSNVVTTSVPSLALYDDFDDPGTAWALRRTSSPHVMSTTVTYLAGTLKTGLYDKYDFSIISPMRPAPPTPYRIRMRTRIIHTASSNSYGIVFGGNGGTICPTDRSNGGDPAGCFYHYYRLNVVWGGNYLKFNVKRIDYHDAEDKSKGKGVGLPPFDNFTWIDDKTQHLDWNEWEIKVYNNGFEIYVNDYFLGKVSDTHYVHEPYYGIFTATGEFNAAEFEHDYFYIDPLPATQ